MKVKGSTEGGSWGFMISNPLIIKIAHAQAVKHSNQQSNIVNQKVVGIADFKSLLIHLFAISILWVHFKNADDWVDGYDFGNLSLSLEEFKLACRTVSAAHVEQELSDEQIEEDFNLLDANKNNSLAFLEVSTFFLIVIFFHLMLFLQVCDYCCRFINSEFERTNGDSQQQQSGSVKSGANDFAIDPSLLKGSPGDVPISVPPVEVLLDLSHGSSVKMENQFSSVQKKNSLAMDAMNSEIVKNQNVADFVEIKVTTENQMNQIFS